MEGALARNGELLFQAAVAVRGTSSYPDATHTLRLSYGTIAGWAESGKQIPAMTRLSGLYARNTGEFPFAVAPSWLAARQKLDQEMPFDIATTNDIIGGNSGSPLINRDGEVVALIFDGNRARWAATTGTTRRRTGRWPWTGKPSSRDWKRCTERGAWRRRSGRADPMREAMVRTELDAIRELLGSKPRPTGWEERRRRLDEVGSIWPVADDVMVQAVDLGGLPGEWSIVPGSDASRVLLFFHGGGYCSGSILSHRRLVTEAGRAAGCRTLAVGYRLAPEHPFPAALEDALSSWRFLREQGIAAHDIAVGGDSAGGGLTIALITHLRDTGLELPAADGSSRRGPT